MITSKAQLVKTLKEQIATSDRQAVKALVTVYQNQTSTEQAAENVHVHNNIGFRSCDATFMTRLAKAYLRYHKLSDKQMACVKRTMPIYANQLINQSLAEGKIRKEGKEYVW